MHVNLPRIKKKPWPFDRPFGKFGLIAYVGNLNQMFWEFVGYPTE